MPGANHANAGTPAFAAAYDSLIVLAQWVEVDRPPVDPTVAGLNHSRTRPLCEHPSWPG